MTGTAANILIDIANLDKTYDTGAAQVHALRNVSLRIRAGEYVAVMGQSGSGKSTLMNILGCLDRLFTGIYALDGVDIASRSNRQLSVIRSQKIGFVFQSYNLIPRMTSLKNVEMPMIYARKNRAFRQRMAQILLEKVGLGDRMDHLPNELSGGQKQRVAIARALANDPPILLADEPTGNLDTASSEEIMELFTALNREGTTVIVVTHENDIASMTNRIIRFKDGRVVDDSDLRRAGP
ncbi:MAG: ABC transporter ATP-binding protein [Clostridiales bacterium]|nr:ABC transporter ATP-binding protein [Clostridiales bacterium]